MKQARLFSLLIITVFLFSCNSSKQIGGNGSQSIRKIRFINEYVVPNTLKLNGTTVGGLSGIDYDAKNDVYYLICDDRSERNPARFYKAKIHLTDKGIDSIQFVDAITLLDATGKPYPSPKTASKDVPDPESMRYNPLTNQLLWTSEGERIVNKTRVFVEDPGVYIADMNGQYKDSFALPANMHMHTTENGPRRNGVFEGSAFSSDYSSLFVSVEEPLYEDGPRAGSGDSTAWLRFIQFDTKTKQPVAEYAYKVDAVEHTPIPIDSFKINGISDIMNIGEKQFLVIERSFSFGHPINTIKVYLADARQADNVMGITSLPAAPSLRPIKKKLLLNMDKLSRYIDNVEGVTFGPVLSNGHRTLIFVVDNNFDEKEKTQFFLFEVL